MCKDSVGYGDADPSNVSPLVRGAEMRVAETRAVNRALRKAYGIGICSVEEIGTSPGMGEKIPPRNANGNGNGAEPPLLQPQSLVEVELVPARFRLRHPKCSDGMRSTKLNSWG
jgi:hypothetical protein